MKDKRRIAVIGSNSFSAGDFIDLLLEDEGNDVIGISRSPEKSDVFLRYRRRTDRSNFKFHQLDLNLDMPAICNLIKAFEPEYIVNFAAQGEVQHSWDHPLDWFKTNTLAITELADFLKDCSFLKKYVHISTPEVYGTCHNSTEETPMQPSTPYAASKAAGDLSLFTFCINKNLPLVMVRGTNVYGPHQQLYRIIPRSFIYIKMGRTIELHGGGKAIKSFIHIRDVSRGELAILEHGKIGEVYHLSPEQGTPVREIVKIICEKVGVDFAQATNDVADRIGQDSIYVIDSSKARKEVGWKSEISLDQGLTEVHEWIEREWSTIENETLEYVHLK